jgi:ankyrin repeat protein
LICAAYGGDSNSVRVLLAAGADIQATNSDGLTAIHYARNADVAALLITAGADPAARLGGETPAETATRLGHFSALAVITNAPAQTKETRQ